MCSILHVLESVQGSILCMAFASTIIHAYSYVKHESPACRSCGDVAMKKMLNMKVNKHVLLEAVYL